MEHDDKSNTVQFQDLKGQMNEGFYKRIQQKPNKKFYFELGFNSETNDNFNNPDSPLPSDNIIFTPQINNITMEMPNVPLLSQWNEIKNVPNKNFIILI